MSGSAIVLMLSSGARVLSEPAQPAVSLAGPPQSFACSDPNGSGRIQCGVAANASETGSVGLGI